MTAFLKSEPVKVLVVNYENKEHLRDYLEKTADFADGKINRFFSSNEYLEHVAPGIDKGSAVRFLCEYTGIPLCNTIAAGDAENDISMIRAAHIGCAMKMTEEEVQEVLKQRRLAWKPKERKYKKGVLRLFSELAASPMKGAYLEYDK